MTETRRVALLANPERDRLVSDVASALDSLDSIRLEPASATDRADAVRRAVADGADTVVAVGGDGTQRSVAEGLVGTDAALGVIPGGTVNLLAQVLGLGELDRAVEAIVSGTRRSIDVGRSNGELFVLNTSSGLDASVITEAARGHKERYGRLSFLRAAVSSFRHVRATHLVVTVDGDACYEGRATSVIVTNVAERSSSDLRIAPSADFDDGVLDVLIVRAEGVWATLRLVVTLVRGREPRTDDLLRCAGSSIDVVWARPMDCQRDGDATDGSARYEISADPGALTVLT